MSNPPQPTLQITIADYRAVAQPLDRWQLTIRWRFENVADQPLYLLLTQPLVTMIADPLVLDHSAYEPPVPLVGNAPRSFRIVIIAPRDTLHTPLDYALAFPTATQSLRVVGRFGYSRIAPDPAWERGKNWQQIERWQQIAESQPLTVAP